MLPVGTVTLLLSDFEGSVRAWQADPDAMASVVGELEKLVDDAVGRHRGVRPLEQGEGDSFVAAFSRATEAVATALEIQLATAERAWPGDTRVRLRMALHTGEAQLRGEANYMGAAINRCARLRALAHGGQVLLSGATHDLIADHHQLKDVDFVDLGTHRLRDLARPEHVFQLRHPGLPSDFAALRGLDVVPNNLPTQLTTFIGRAAEVAQVARLLDENRLVTLTGSGGCGKTRLAVQAAAEVSSAFPDGVWFADLAPVVEPAGVALTVAGAVGAVAGPGQDPLDAVVTRAQNSTLLLVVDNCEHLVESCCRLVQTVLRSCPDVRILATSREVLGGEGEVPLRVPSLPLPPATGSPAVDALTTSDAVRLFIDRALRARPNFTVTNDTAGDVAAICRRLDGIPLAIELAAARVRVLSPAQIAAGLDDRFRLLGSGSRTALARQQTLVASVAWSHELLSDEERSVLRRLSVFVGSFDLNAAEAIAAGGDVDAVAVLDLLSAIVDKSLVVADDEGLSTRYRMLETLRAYATDRLVDAGEVDGTYGRAAAHYLATAESLGEARYGRLVPDLDTIRGIVAWAFGAKPELALQLTTVLALALIRGNDELGARRWLEEAIAQDPGTDRLARARALAELAYVCFPASDIAAIPAAAEEAVAIGRELGDEQSVARALNARGWALGTVSSVEQGAGDLDEAIAIARRIGDDWCLIDALKNRGYIALVHGDPAGAKTWLEEAVAAASRAGDSVKEDEAGLWLVWADTNLGRMTEGRRRAEKLAPSFESRSAEFFVRVALCYHAMTLAQTDDVESARQQVQRAPARCGPAERDNPWLLGVTLMTGALVEFAAGDLDAARAFGDQAEPVCRATGAPVMLVTLLLYICNSQLEAGDIEAARRANDEALAIAEAQTMAWHTAFAQLNAARLAERVGEREHAEELAHQALVAATGIEDQQRIAECLELLALLAAESESYQEAARLVGAAGAVRQRAGCAPLSPDRIRLDELDAWLRCELVDDELARLHEEGAALDADAAVAYARRGRGERRRPSSGWSSLTPAEVDVVRLVAQGLTNPQVAERLFITRATVKAHLGHIFPKLGVTTRAELAALATRRELA